MPRIAARMLNETFQSDNDVIEKMYGAEITH
jgi:hypothetical protein